MRFHPSRPAQDPVHRSAVRLLEADPGLGTKLSPARHQAANDRLVARRLVARGGSFSDHTLGVTESDGLGLLVLEGVIARELALCDNVSVELLGAGDLLRSWAPDDPARLLRSQVRWTIVEPARFAVLGDRLADELASFPEVQSVLIDRVVDRAHRVGVAHAISHLNGVDRRIVVLFWHLAERWGQISSEGVQLPLRLPHRIIAQLVGARRPTVSSALSTLVDRGDVARRADGGWVLKGEPVGLPTGEASRVIRLRHRRPRSEVTAP